MPKTTTKSLSVPLSAPAYQKLRAESTRTRRPASALAREAIDTWLAEQQRKSVHNAIQNYARTTAGTRADLDPELEAAGVEHLISDTRQRRKSK